MALRVSEDPAALVAGPGRGSVGRTTQLMARRASGDGPLLSEQAVNVGVKGSTDSRQGGDPRASRPMVAMC